MRQNFSRTLWRLVLDGLKAEILYYKTMLGKVGIQVEVARRGKYKSAAESLVSDTISAPNYEQLNALLTGFDKTYVQGVAQSRNIGEAAYRKILNEQATFPIKRHLRKTSLTRSAISANLKNRFAKGLTSPKKMMRRCSFPKRNTSKSLTNRWV